MFEKVKATILHYFPTTSAIIVWGSSIKPNFSPKFGDIDLIIVDEQKRTTEDSQSLLNQVVDDLKTDINLDPALTTKDKLSSLKLITTYNTRTAHGIDHFQIKYNSKVIYGDEKILDIIPEITMDEAIRDVAPHVRDVFISNLKSKVTQNVDMKTLLTDQKDEILVVIRTLYTLRTKLIGTKLETAEYLSDTYPELQPVSEYLRLLYIKQEPSDVPEKNDLLELLKITETEINSFLS